MEIKILKQLELFNSLGGFVHKGVSMERILALEQTYNNGNPFPRALRELLYLAGDYCRYLDKAGADTAEELQEEARAKLTFAGMTINRPFYCIDTMGDYAAARFVILYTDTTNDNPMLCTVNYADNTITENEKSSISGLINARIDDVKNGRGPF
ncbi:MAG: hypothetical protein JNM67_00485 [Bacteroidetes bacterium]|nr:hypothetical protein [Bacteroidota bacterium]